MNRYNGKGIFRYLLLFCVLAVILPTAILAQGTPNGAPPSEPMPTGPPDAYPTPPGPPDSAIAPTPEGTRSSSSPGPHASSAPNRIVHHAATPAQLIKTGNGLQFYYIGSDGSTASGPHIPSFSELAEMYPSGDWVSLLSAPNPLTGKHVNVDYLPDEMKIRVSTFYPDSEYDTDKPYIFNFGSDYSINVEAW
ncbi:MAG: hypothetical protein OXI52_06335 [Caldilineaceae bacterium]|nr:hypothetical protein [Caldilineaceae bacterium]